MSAFDRAWDLVKAPWDVHSEDYMGHVSGVMPKYGEGEILPEVSRGKEYRPLHVKNAYAKELQARGLKPVTVEGPLYSGGDREDTPEYWTPNLDEALAYALFGSAVPQDSSVSSQVRRLGGIPMRETRPQVWVAPDLKLPKNPKIQRDIYSQAFRNMPNESINSAPMPQSQLRQLIADIISGERTMKRGWASDTSAAWGHPRPHDQDAHLRGALERFDTGIAGNLGIPDELRDLISDSAQDDKNWGFGI
jgi:hypothetical protein